MSSIDENIIGSSSSSADEQNTGITTGDKSDKGLKRDEKGRLVEGTAPGPGRPILSEEQKIKKKVQKELVRDYKEHLASALPRISPILIDKAVSNDDRKEQMEAIKEINKIVVGDAPKIIGGDEDNPLRIIIVDKDLAEKYNLDVDNLQ